MIRRLLEKLRRGSRRDLDREERLRHQTDVEHRRAEIHQAEHRSRADHHLPPEP